jgi:hypothetical protein
MILALCTGVPAALAIPMHQVEHQDEYASAPHDLGQSVQPISKSTFEVYNSKDKREAKQQDTLSSCLLVRACSQD